MDVDRRAVVKAAGVAWSVPAVLHAVAAPAVAGSIPPPPPPPPPCIDGVSFNWVDVQQWNGRTLPQGIEVYNDSGRDVTLTGYVSNTPSYAGIGVPGATEKIAKNGGSFSVVIPNGGSVILRITVDKDTNNSTGFMTFTSVCDGEGTFQMKTVGKIDRVTTGQ